MTLAELIPAIQSLPAADRVRLIHTLAASLDADKSASPLVPHKVYYVATPYNVFGAGQALMDAMEHLDHGNTLAVDAK
jgi:hypothetical protein